MAIAVRTRPAVRIDTRSALRIAGAGGFLLALGYLVIAPLVRLQTKAFTRGDGYREAFSQPDICRTVRSTVMLALGSLVVAMVLGTLLAWAASRRPKGLRLLR